MSVKWAVMVSTVLVLPFAVLEWRNQASSIASVPYPLFTALWLLPFVFILLVMGVVRSGVPKSAAAYALTALKAACLLLIAFFWVSLVIDQMPCFLGVPNCD